MTSCCAHHRRTGRPDPAVDRHEHARADRSRGRGARARTPDAAALHEHLPVEGRRTESAGDPAAGRALRRAGRLFRPRGRAWRRSLAAVALGACVVERHITLDRAMWGSDQAASVEPQRLRAPRQGHPGRRGGARRRRQARLRQRDAGAATSCGASGADAGERIGIMQGRLSSPVPGRLQSVSVVDWEAEFRHASACGFDSIEWLFEEPPRHGESALDARPAGSACAS